MGRIDGWDAEANLVEEVKTTRADVAALHERLGAVHDAQLALYAAMLVLADESLEALTLRLVYLHPDTPDEVAFEQARSAQDLAGFFASTCRAYVDWLRRTRARLAERNKRLRSMGFPHAGFRPDQRRLAKHVYRGFRDRVDWLLEAPTGSGKTIACVFPALKAMGEGELDRVVFLTSRTTGQRAAEGAFKDAAADAAVAVTVTAKDRICFNPGTPCDPELCEYASGYYDRMPSARLELLAQRPVDRAAVEAVARRHRVCPFELSLDAAAWADAVICDYNYVFDPVVALKRLDNAVFRRVGLIVDEAHQLGDRVRGMLGMNLRQALVKAALAEPELPAALAKGLRCVDRAMADLARQTRPAHVDADAEWEIHEPQRLLRAIDRWLAAAAETPVDARAQPLAGEAHLDLLRFRRACDWAEEGSFRYVANGAGRRFGIEVVCTVPSDHIQRTMAPFHGSVRVSGTLTPPHVFQRLHGFDADAGCLRSAGIGSADRLGVFIVADISTYYRDRAATLPKLVTLIQRVCSASPGNHLVAFPSFEYANAAARACAGEHIRCQRPDMDAAEREAFIGWLNEENAGRIGFVVMGGVFAESVDFDSRALHGIVVVGIGVPPRSLKRDLIGADSAAGGIAADGDEIAYRQPAMTRVAQAVGRIARGGAPGVAVLVDPRFRSPAYRAFLPARWRARVVPSKAAFDGLRH